METKRPIFTKEMKKTHTILFPNMASIHFKILGNVFNHLGYKVKLLENSSPTVVENGLMYVHNDTCYPALLVIGQMIDAIKNGGYDPNKIALLISQTGGGCRASNYIHLLRKALIKAGYPNVPVISLNLSGLEKNPGFKITIPMIRKFVAGLVYGDLLMHLTNQVRPYEINKGDANHLLDTWIEKISGILNNGKGYKKSELYELCSTITKEYDAIKRTTKKKIKVGVVGEIYVKYASLGNNNLEEFLESQDVEYMVPGIMGFSLFKVDNRLEDIKLYGGSVAKKIVVNILYNYLKDLEEILYNAIVNNSKFIPTSKYEHIKELAKEIIGLGSKMGEGWLLTAEMMELTELGYHNIVCTQPFGCLPNHINGKGMIRKITEIMPNANIVPIDYDPSATRVNQENRIKLMLSVAKENL